MDATRRWLDELDRRCEDQTWLAAHENDLRAAIKRAVFLPPLLHLGVKAIFLIHPYLLNASDLNPWMDVFYHALIEMMNLRDGERLTRLWETMGQSFAQIDQPHKAIAAFHNTLERARQQQDIVKMLKAYVGLFKAQMFRQDAKFSDELVEQAVSLLKKVDDLEWRAALYQAIAFAYTHRGESRAALAYGQTAFACWRKLSNVHEMARTAFSMATVSRTSGLLEPADRYLELAKALYLQTDDPRQFALVAYEQGTLSKKRGDYEAAAQWLAMALREFQELKPPHYRLHFVAAAHHGLGIVRILLGQFDTARDHLETAFSMWVQLENIYEQACLCNEMGYLEGQLRNIPEAYEWLHRGMELCHALPDMPSRRRLQALLDATLAELDDASLSSG